MSMLRICFQPMAGHNLPCILPSQAQSPTVHTSCPLPSPQPGSFPLSSSVSSPEARSSSSTEESRYVASQAITQFSSSAGVGAGTEGCAKGRRAVGGIQEPPQPVLHELLRKPETSVGERELGKASVVLCILSCRLWV